MRSAVELKSKIYVYVGWPKLTWHNWYVRQIFLCSKQLVLLIGDRQTSAKPNISSKITVSPCWNMKEEAKWKKPLLHYLSDRNWIPYCINKLIVYQTIIKCLRLPLDYQTAVFRGNAFPWEWLVGCYCQSFTRESMRKMLALAEPATSCSLDTGNLHGIVTIVLLDGRIRRSLKRVCSRLELLDKFLSDQESGLMKYIRHCCVGQFELPTLF